MKPSTTVANLSLKLSYLVAAILALLPFHAFLTTWAGSNTGFIDIWRIWKELIMVLVLLPAGIWLVWRSNSLKKWFFQSRIVRLFGIYIILHAILGVWALGTNKVNEEALIYALGINLRFVLFFLICATIAANSNFLERHWKKILLLPAAVVIMFGILQKFVLPYDFLRHFGYGDNTIPAYQTVDNDVDHRRIQSFLRGANPLGAYLTVTIPALLIVLRRKTIFLWLGSIASLVVLFYSYSRSGWLGTMTACFLLSAVMLERTRQLKWLFTVAIISVLFIIGLAYSLRDNDTAQNVLFHSSEDSISSQSSNAARLQYLESGVKDIFHEPFGRGPGTAGPASFRNDKPARIAENYFLQIGQETGVTGMGLFISINVLVAKELWRRRKNQLCLILVVSLAGLTVVNLISHAWTDDTLAYIWWGLAGVALAPTIAHASKLPAQRRSR